MALLVPLLLIAQATSGPIPDQLAGFESLGLPSCAGAKFVEVSKARWTTLGALDWLPTGEVVGWLLSLDAAGGSLLDEDLQVRALAPRAELVTTRVWQSSGCADVAAGIRELDFAAFCREAMREKTAVGPSPIPVPELRPAVLAWWAHQRGDQRLRDELLQGLRRRFGPASAKQVGALLAPEIASNARWRAQEAACVGRPRVELLAIWRSIALLSPPGHAREAARMVAAYESLLVEDAAFRAPSPAELASMPAREQVDVWLHRLRDVDLRIANIFPGGGGPEPEETHPTTRAIRALGWKTVPALIARLDDERPTRTLYWARFSRGCVQLSHAELCRRLLRGITGQCFETRAEFEQWWPGEAAGDAFFLRRLSAGKDVRYAAQQLLARNPDAHLPRIVAEIEATDGEERAELAHAFAPHATHAHLGLLESLLDLENPADCLEVAEGLARLGAPMRGVERMAALAVAAADTAPEPPLEFLDGTSWVDVALAFVRTHDRRCFDRVVLTLIDAAASRLRLRGLAAARGVRSPVVRSRLAALLDDPTPTGWASRYEIRTCDAAADALSAALGLGDRFRLDSDPLARDRTIAALRAHWTGLRESAGGR